MSRSRYRRTPIYIRAHARKRAEERLPGKKITPDRIRRHIDGALRAGVPVNERGAIEVDIGDGRIAICVPEFLGGWSVITFINDNQDAC